MPTLPVAVRPDFERFVAGPAKVREALAGLDAAALNRRPPGQDWSIRDILMHLVDAEILFAARFRMVIASTDISPELPVFDQEVWKRRLHYLWRDPESAAVTFQMLRYTSGELLQQCDAAAFQRTGIYPGIGPVTLSQLLAESAEHSDDHATQIVAFRG